MKSSIPFDVETVLRIYLQHPNEIGNAQIRALFGVKSNASVAKIKRAIREIMLKEGLKVWNPANVSTEATFKHAGIEIERYKKLYLERRKIGLCESIG